MKEVICLKRILLSFCFVTIICSLTAISFSGIGKILTSADIIPRKTIILDAGHGGFDGGAVAGDGTVEKDINLAICKKIKVHLEFNGYEVVMTRSEDTGTEIFVPSVVSKVR